MPSLPFYVVDADHGPLTQYVVLRLLRNINIDKNNHLEVLWRK